MISKAEFLGRFLLQASEDQPYWVVTPLPSRVLEKIDARVKDELCFVSHQGHFDLLAGIIDFCVSEFVEATIKNNAAPNTLKHPRILALADAPADVRAGVICAAAQAMRWIDEVQPWVKGHTLQNEIAKRVLVGILRSFGKKKQSFSTDDLQALVRLGGSIQGQDDFGLLVRMAILELLATNATGLAADSDTRDALSRYLNRMTSPNNLAYVETAIDKLRAKLKTT